MSTVTGIVRAGVAILVTVVAFEPSDPLRERQEEGSQESKQAWPPRMPEDGLV